MLLPLHCYDEAGRIKPPLWLYWMLLILCSDWIALVFSLVTFGQTSELLSVLYADKTVLGWRLLATWPFLTVILLMGNRERLWKKELTGWRLGIMPLIWTGNIVSIAAQMQTVLHDQWDFHWTPACFILVNVLVFVTVMRSRHIRLMVSDWRDPETVAAQKIKKLLTLAGQSLIKIHRYTDIAVVYQAFVTNTGKRVGILPCVKYNKGRFGI